MRPHFLAALSYPFAIALLVGAILPAPVFAARIDGEQGGRPLRATLTGAAEVPVPGDPDGSGTALVTLNPGQGVVCFRIEVANITLPALAAHIHSAPAGVPGPVVVPFVAPGADGTASGCTSDVDRDLILDILRNPAAYYVNVHTTDFPGGAVRGQLSK